MMEFANYPYAERLRQLSDLGDSASRFADATMSSNDFRKFVTLLGSSYATADQSVRDTLCTLVRDGYPVRRDNVTTASNSSDHEQAEHAQHATVSDVQVSENAAQDHQLDFSRYTTALQHHGDACGSLVSWTISQISTAPIRFRSIASFEDISCEGVAKNKKEAKHLASREACRILRISV